MNEAGLMDKIRTRLSSKRFKHTVAVKEEAIKLAKHYGYNDINNVVIAALLHDIGRAYDQQAMNAYVKKYNLDNIYLDNMALAHSKVGAFLIKEAFGVNNKDIIEAVSYHTTGRKKMSLLEKIIYLSDIIEPGRQFKGIERLRALSYLDIDEACLFALDLSIKYIVDNKEYLHIDTLYARNYLLIRNK